MSALLPKMFEKALKLSIPLSVRLDLTYRCNERCAPGYLDHDHQGEMTSAEIKHLLDEMAEAGVFILTCRGQRRSSESESEESGADSSAPRRLRWKCIGERFCVIWSHLHRSNRTHARN